MATPPVIDSPKSSRSELIRVNFSDYFSRATAGHTPFPYQIDLATGPALPTVLEVPTGVGKTAAAVLSWLWRRKFVAEPVREQTPRRLVYCLPMRTLVEQTEAACRAWRANLALSPDDLAIQLLMAGEDSGDWDGHPERDTILVGTQDMLLSRALNRGYGMSRYRWPIHFGLLNSDCLWVLDETQLMGVGVTTSAQLQGLRDALGVYGSAQTLWMSATLAYEQLETVDHPRPAAGWPTQTLSATDEASPVIQRLLTAEKPLNRSRVALSADNAKKEAAEYAAALAVEVVDAHQPGTLTLAVVNRVDRAQQLYKQLSKTLASSGSGKKTSADLHLIHSRFRPFDRTATQTAALDESKIAVEGPGSIVVSTQAIEAGVDVSATTLIFELAPWSSCVQRLGRCNRRGDCGRDDRPPAKVVWVDIDTSDEKKAKELSLPYEPSDLTATREYLEALADGGSTSLASVDHTEPLAVNHTIRRKDLLELFDTSPDIAGNDLDISRFIRESVNRDIQAYWRKWDAEAAPGQPPNGDNPDGVLATARREELCSVSVAAARSFLEKLKDRAAAAWRWNPLDRQWQAVQAGELFPGMTILLPLTAGGYDPALGWTGDPKDQAFDEVPFPVSSMVVEDDFLESDETVGPGLPVLLGRHLDDVATATTSLRNEFKGSLPTIPWDSLIRASWWHDVGKAHEAFQKAMADCEAVRATQQADSQSTQLWAKSGQRKRPLYRVADHRRRGFRHELASALAWLNSAGDEVDRDLIAFLIAAHHGKVRANLRSLPNESSPTDAAVRFSRGIWEGDELPEVIVGNGDVSPAFSVNLELMELGGGAGSNSQSWAARVLALRDSQTFGPFRLAFLECLLRVADWRGSSKTPES